MSILHAIVLGLTQGLSEFLPISSSGHLILVPWLLGWNDFDDPSVKKAFDVALHMGTLFAAVAYFRRDLVRYVRDGIRAALHPRQTPTADGRLAWLLVASSLPAAAAGALLEGFIDDELGRIWLIALSLIVFGVVLLWADRQPGRRPIDGYTVRDALLIGSGQVIALNPGTSRSGATITMARVVGFDRDAAARISFLMAIPVTVGAIVYKVGKLAADGIPTDLRGAMAVGIATSAASGWAAVWGTLRLVRTRSFTPFVVYRVVVGLAVLGLLATSFR
jgi:undecaprenyl-diphosphatase